MLYLVKNKLVVLAAFGLVVLVVLCTTVAVAEDAIDSRFSKLMEQYQKLDTVHLKSKITIALHVGKTEDPSTADVTRTTIDYEYWGAKGRRYRVESRYYDANGILQQAWSFAYDGKVFQILDHTTKVFGFGREDPKQNPCAPENPLFAPVRFLSRDDDNCRACTLKLSDVLSPTTWQEKRSVAKLVRLSEQEPGLEVVQMPYGVVEGKAVFSRVYFGGSPDYTPTRIEILDQQGQIRGCMSISYQPISKDGKLMHWPSLVHYSVRNERGKTELELIAKVEALEINEQLPTDVFIIDASSAHAFWDRDAKMFVDTRHQ